ncbi:unnamed protein product [Caenorhabditis auriculariae]|uniref:Serine/threonine specific protein phosphatases domain-containing protein n=1 Tax=Caenorhabditis auriculariae TaxID=2777116 RepID=A0A8S1HWP1_9PELO|nr:unnamed protein product [Caenorhabditis auriculariae]
MLRSQVDEFRKSCSRFLHELLLNSTESLKNVDRVVELNGPVVLCGDLRSHFGDLLQIFQKCGWPFDTRYAFLGNYCDGRSFSLETLVLLLSCQISYPDSFYLLRGAFEHDFITKNSMLGEIRVRFPIENESKQIEHQLKIVWSSLPLSLVLNKKIVCTNTGLSPTTSETAVSIKNTVENKAVKVGVLFEEKKSPNTKKAIEEETKARKELCTKLGASLFIHSNKIIEKGYEFRFENSVLNLFSASGVASTYDNRAAVLSMDSDNVARFVDVFGGRGVGGQVVPPSHVLHF